MRKHDDFKPAKDKPLPKYENEPDYDYDDGDDDGFELGQPRTDRGNLVAACGSGYQHLGAGSAEPVLDIARDLRQCLTLGVIRKAECCQKKW